MELDAKELCLVALGLFRYHFASEDISKADNNLGPQNSGFRPSPSIPSILKRLTAYHLAFKR